MFTSFFVGVGLFVLFPGHWALLCHGGGGGCLRVVPTTRLRMVAREPDLCSCLQRKHATSFGISEKVGK